MNRDDLPDHKAGTTPFGEKWDRWFMGMAKYIASASKDPSTKVGALIVGPDRTPVSWGYNGFPRGVADTKERYENREVKYLMVCHSERNAILWAHRDLHGCVMYTTAAPCAPCAGMIIQAGILHVVAPVPPAEFAERWKKDLEITNTMFNEAGVTLWSLRSLPEEAP